MWKKLEAGNWTLKSGCGCYKCFHAGVDAKIAAHPEMSFADKINMRARFIVCEHCGNKRCPHGTDHTLGCTDSNALGQRGSRYETWT